MSCLMGANGWVIILPPPALSTYLWPGFFKAKISSKTYKTLALSVSNGLLKLAFLEQQAKISSLRAF